MNLPSHLSTVDVTLWSQLINGNYTKIANDTEDWKIFYWVGNDEMSIFDNWAQRWDKCYVANNCELTDDATIAERDDQR